MDINYSCYELNGDKNRPNFNFSFLRPCNL